MAQVDYYLKIPPIEGESADHKHKGEMEVESFSWGETRSAGTVEGDGAPSGEAHPKEFHFVKKVDKSSPVLMIGCAIGQQFKTAVLTGRKTGAGRDDYLRITMENVSITSYDMVAAPGDDLPMDQVSLTFTTLEMSYKAQKPDGSLGLETKETYDFVAQKQV
jgi:type VI secretion system secreted protein Hcp